MADVLAANQGLYDAVEHGDLDLMRSLWLPGETTVCVHPGAEPVRGTSAVLRSWAVVMANTGYIQFILTDVVVDERDDVAVVSCVENVLSEAEGESVETFAGGKAAASNVFVRTSTGWKVWMHHSSPVIQVEEEA